MSAKIPSTPVEVATTILNLLENGTMEVRYNSSKTSRTVVNRLFKMLDLIYRRFIFGRDEWESNPALVEKCPGDLAERISAFCDGPEFHINRFCVDEAWEDEDGTKYDMLHIYMQRKRPDGRRLKWTFVPEEDRIDIRYKAVYSDTTNTPKKRMKEEWRKVVGKFEDAIGVYNLGMTKFYKHDSYTNYTTEEDFRHRVGMLKSLMNDPDITVPITGKQAAFAARLWDDTWPEDGVGVEDFEGLTKIQGSEIITTLKDDNYIMADPTERTAFHKFYLNKMRSSL